MTADETLDLRGLKCPLPALMTRRALLRAAPGRIFEVLCDDPLCHIDLPHLCRQENFEILSEARNESVTRLVVRRP